MSDGTEWKIWFARSPDIPAVRRPYLDNVIDYTCDGSSGQFVFNGKEVFQHFTLPYEFNVIVSREDSEPYSVTELPETDEWDRLDLYHVYERRHMRIRIETVEEIRDTSEPWWEEEEQGYICLFPTSIQKVTFTVLTSEEDTVLKDRDVRSRVFTVYVPDRKIELDDLRMEVELVDVDDDTAGSCSSGEIESIE